MANEDVYVGIDLSLVGTGFTIKHGDSVAFETIKTVPKDFPNDLARLIHIRDTIMGKIPIDVRMICIEDFFMGHIGSAIKIAMLGTTVRLVLYEKKLPFTLISPSQLKKFVTGKGVGEKNLILREVYKRWNQNCKDDNQADSVILAYLAEALIVGVKSDTPKFQVEVIETVRKDRPRYNVKESWGGELKRDDE